jgi:KipI family sensor histidine kinase inhibitor
MDGTPRILAAGDQALLIEFGEEIKPAINQRVQAFAQRANQHKISGIGELVPSYCTVLIYYDPLYLSFSQAASWAREFLSSGSVEVQSTPTIKEVPVLYGGPYGPDIDFIAQHNGISAEEVIRFHTSQTYLVYVVGFSPGFTAMGTVPEKIQAPRLPTPRTKVPAGSVGIGGMQTGIYPVESPGGWRLIGRTPLKLFDLNWSPPSHFQAGDYARFYSISEEEFLEIASPKET